MTEPAQPSPPTHPQGGRRPVVVLAEELSPATVAALGPDFEIVQVDGTDRAALLAAVAGADALLVRSATQVDAEVFGAARRLRVVARAGVGLDNVDVRAATQAGVMVVNAPTSNIVSAAEHAIALVLAAARRVPQAHASLKGGSWQRSAFVGVELFEKTLGVVGLGRIGVLVAQRLAAFGMSVVAFDPYVGAARAAQLGVRLVSLEELLAAADVITVHLPRTPETVGLLGADALRGSSPASSSSTRPAAGSSTRRRCTPRSRRAGSRPPASTSSRRAEHGQPAVRAGQRRRHAAPRRLDRGGAGAGRRLGRPLGAAGPRGRAGAGRRQRLGRGDRRGGPARHPAHREARPGVHRPRRRRPHPARRRGARGDHRARRHACSRLAALKGLFRGRRRGAGVVRQRPGPRPGARHRRPARHRPGQRGVPERHHAARDARRRHAGLRRGHADRARSRSRSSSASTGSTWRRRSPTTCSCSATSTGPAWSARVGGLLGAAGVNIAAMQVARAAEGGEAVGVLTARPGRARAGARGARARGRRERRPAGRPHRVRARKRDAARPWVTWNHHAARPHPRSPRRDLTGRYPPRGSRACRPSRFHAAHPAGSLIAPRGRADPAAPISLSAAHAAARSR